MRFVITMKDPDGVYESVREAARASVDTPELEGLRDDDREELRVSHQERAEKGVRRWFKYGEYVRIEVDLDEGTAKVLPAT